MQPTPELVAEIQRDRERDIERSRLARLADCARACCAPGLGDRVARLFGRTRTGACEEIR